MPEQTLLAFCSPFYEDAALNELAPRLDARLDIRLGPGALALTTGLEAQEVVARLVAAPPVFTLQVHTLVQRVPRGANAAQTARSLLETYAVSAEGRCWLVCDLDGHLGPAAAGLADALRALGAPVSPGAAPPAVDAALAADAPPAERPPDGSEPSSVITAPDAGLGPPIAVVVADAVYAGRACCGAGLSAPCWPAGRPRLPYEAGLPSRSALKLLEALAVFGVAVPEGGWALDLGAAPGGWTLMLARRGAHVVAVDPGALDPEVAALPSVAYHAETAQLFLRRNRRRFDLIVDDMRLDARESARIMLQAAPALAPGGLAIMTLKLPRQAPTAVVRQAREILRPAYPLQQARCLYYNRNEVTLALGRTPRRHPIPPLPRSGLPGRRPSG